MGLNKAPSDPADPLLPAPTAPPRGHPRSGDVRHRQSGAAPDAEAVEYVDIAGALWQVSERDARNDPGASGPRCLVFTSQDVARRVWRYPPGWRELPAALLEALSWAR